MVGISSHALACVAQSVLFRGMSSGTSSSVKLTRLDLTWVSVGMACAAVYANEHALLASQGKSDVPGRVELDSLNIAVNLAYHPDGPRDEARSQWRAGRWRRGGFRFP